MEVLPSGEHMGRPGGPLPERLDDVANRSAAVIVDAGRNAWRPGLGPANKLHRLDAEGFPWS